VTESLRTDRAMEFLYRGGSVKGILDFVQVVYEGPGVEAL
jgi:hypothetical protein